MHFRQGIHKGLHEYFSAQIRVVSGKMRFHIVLLLLFAVCGPSTSLTAFREDFGLRGDPHGINSEPRAFFTSFGNWFRHLKNRVYNKLFGPIDPTPPTSPTELLDLDRVELQHRLRNRERFLVDLSTLSFDSERDWGFRVGNWYFIRKGHGAGNGFRDNDESDWDMRPRGTVPPSDMSSSGVNFDSNSEEDDRFIGRTSSDIPLTELPTTNTVIQSMTQEPNTQPTTETDMEIDSSKFEGFSTRAQKRIEDNEADGFIHDDSVMVLRE